LKNLRKFATNDPKPDTDFKSFARRCVQYVFDICHNELTLVESFFQDGPLFARYSSLVQGIDNGGYAEKLDENRFIHLTTLHNFLTPYLSDGDLQRICDLTNWLETMYMISNDGDLDGDRVREDRRSTAHVLLSKHLWPLSDALFLKAATEIEHFKPSQEDLMVTSKSARPLGKEKHQSLDGLEVDEDIRIYDVPTASVSNAYPTVKTAVKLLVMYNDGVYDRPVRYLMPFYKYSY
jgi:conserved oligomeric Golgi complex subunit 3